MTIAGADYAWSHPNVPALQAAGITFVLRYLSTDPSKNLTAPERDGLHAAGISIVLNWETTADMALRGYQGGLADARAARAQAAALGFPASLPIYYSVDFNDTPAQIATVLDYLHGCADAEGSKDLVGVYGGIATIKAAGDAGFVYLWQTFAWSGQPTDWDGRARIRQTQVDQTIGGVQVDLDEAMVADFGQWLPAGDVAPIDPPELREGASGPWVATLQRALMLAGQVPGQIDASFGAHTLASVLAFQRSRALTQDGIVGPRTWSALETRTRAVQTALSDSGIPVGAIDGIAGPITLGAVVAFQTAHHLATDGIVGPVTSAALGIPR